MQLLLVGCLTPVCLFTLLFAVVTFAVGWFTLLHPLPGYVGWLVVVTVGCTFLRLVVCCTLRYARVVWVYTPLVVVTLVGWLHSQVWITHIYLCVAHHGWLGCCSLHTRLPGCSWLVTRLYGCYLWLVCSHTFALPRLPWLGWLVTYILHTFAITFTFGWLVWFTRYTYTLHGCLVLHTVARARYFAVVVYGCLVVVTPLAVGCGSLVLGCLVGLHTFGLFWIYLVLLQFSLVWFTHTPHALVYDALVCILVVTFVAHTRGRFGCSCRVAHHPTRFTHGLVYMTHYTHVQFAFYPHTRYGCTVGYTQLVVGSRLLYGCLRFTTFTFGLVGYTRLVTHFTHLWVGLRLGYGVWVTHGYVYTCSCLYLLVVTRLLHGWLFTRLVGWFCRLVGWLRGCYTVPSLFVRLLCSLLPCTHFTRFAFCWLPGCLRFVYTFALCWFRILLPCGYLGYVTVLVWVGWLLYTCVTHLVCVGWLLLRFTLFTFALVTRCGWLYIWLVARLVGCCTFGWLVTLVGLRFAGCGWLRLHIWVWVGLRLVTLLRLFGYVVAFGSRYVWLRLVGWLRLVTLRLRLVQLLPFDCYCGCWLFWFGYVGLRLVGWLHTPRLPFAVDCVGCGLFVHGYTTHFFHTDLLFALLGSFTLWLHTVLGLVTHTFCTHTVAPLVHGSCTFCWLYIAVGWVTLRVGWLYAFFLCTAHAHHPLFGLPSRLRSLPTHATTFTPRLHILVLTGRLPHTHIHPWFLYPHLHTYTHTRLPGLPFWFVHTCGFATTGLHSRLHFVRAFTPYGCFG